MKVHRAGDSALLVETGGAAHAHRLRKHLLHANLPGLQDLVPGLSTLLIVADPLALDLDALAQSIPTWELPPGEAGAAREIVVDVTYDGPDLSNVAELTGLSLDDIVERHTRPVYEVAFLGFAPGFAYLTGLDTALTVPRLDTPRTRVPRGSVAIAGNMTVVYPRATPGGWRLIGHTDITLFDPAKHPPAKLAPGDRVRFRNRV